MIIGEFGRKLSSMRQGMKLTNRQLATKASVPSSLIAGLQAGSRSVGELQARKIGKALALVGPELESFVMEAVSTCTDRVLSEAKDYPALFLNFIAKQLRSAGIAPKDLRHFQLIQSEQGQSLWMRLDGGRTAEIHSTLKYA